ncbi:major capsid protein P2 [Marinobacter alkaliphilus]|uniref:Major capsid protein P2 n=1 Tax=Marinobacter alkaliphilus TaxID=254719 RepID=A0ABZ3E7W7_9GAMM
MQRIFKRVQSPEGVSPGQTATVKLAIGVAYNNLMLVTNMDLAHMTEIRVIANNKTIHRYSATERDMKNQFYGEKAFAKVNGKGNLLIPFDRMNMNTRVMEEVTAVHTGVPYQSGEVIRSFYVEIDIADAAISPTLDVYATTSAAQNGTVSRIKHETKHTRSSAGAGELELSDLPFNRPTAQAIQSVFFVPKAPGTGDPVAITKLTVERDLYKVFERPEDLNRFMQDNGERKPQASVHAIDWTENGYGGNALALNGFADYRYRLEMAGEAQITVLSEYLGILGE